MAGELYAGLFKDVYSQDKIKQLVPQNTKLLNSLKHKEGELQGNVFVEGVELLGPGEAAYAEDADGAYNIPAAVNGTTAQAKIEGFSMLVPGILPWPDWLKAKGAGDSGNVKAFAAATVTLVRSLLHGHMLRQEVKFLHGARGIGTIDTGGIAGGDATFRTLTIRASTFAPGILIPMQGYRVEFRTGAGALVGTAAADTKFVLGAASTAATTVVVTGTAQGITDLVAAIGAGAVTMHPFGSFAKQGVSFIEMAAATSGTINNISATTFANWRANPLEVSGSLSIAAILKANSQCVDRGWYGTHKCFVAPRAFALLNEKAVNFRMYDSSYSQTKADAGSETLCYVGPGGKVEIEAHPLMKAGEILGLPMDDCKLLGASPLPSYEVPGHDGEYFMALENQAGSRLVCHSHSAVFCSAPGHSFLLTGFTV